MDREKIIKDIEDGVLTARATATKLVHLPVDKAEDIVELLKEQEAVEPYSMNAERTYGICPKCGKIVFRYGNVEENHYCGVCGQAVKWE